MLKPVQIDFVTLFPEMIQEALGHSIMFRAERAGIVTFRTANPRDFALDNHRSVDDRPFGGGPGMVMMAQPIADALASIGADPSHRTQGTAVVLTDPGGRLFRQQSAREFSKLERVVFVCGHYEGVDERVRTQLCTHAFTIGDFVLTGGELPSLAMADAIVRLLPGAIGDPRSHEDDSHEGGLLGHPLYTKPEEFMGEAVPEVLRGGHHAEIEKWRRRESLARTRQNRPDLFATADLSSGDLDLS